MDETKRISTVVLRDKSEVSTSNTRSRYSDVVLEEFRVLLREKLEKAEGDLVSLRDGVNNSNDTEDTAPSCKGFDDGQKTLSKLENGKLMARQVEFINCLKNALVRIENKTYGICRETGKLISKERLRAVPHTTLSFDAKTRQN